MRVAMAAKKPGRFSYEFPRPALTVDVVVATREPRPRVLLIKRKHDPFAGRWALPGGFVDDGEKLADAARRELKEETGLTLEDLEQLYTAGDPGRDPRGWTVSVVFLARVDADRVQAVAADDAAEVGWHPLDDLPELAFDHRMILDRARVRLADRLP
jgi:8-oxo-dGTP diphosphatase